MRVAVSGPVNALEPFRLETYKPRYRVMAAVETAPAVNTVGEPEDFEMAVYGPPTAVASLSARIEGCAKSALTKAVTVPVEELKLENEGVSR